MSLGEILEQSPFSNSSHAYTELALAELAATGLFGWDGQNITPPGITTKVPSYSRPIALLSVFD